MEKDKLIGDEIKLPKWLKKMEQNPDSREEAQLFIHSYLLKYQNEFLDALPNPKYAKIRKFITYFLRLSILPLLIFLIWLDRTSFLLAAVPFYIGLRILSAALEDELELKVVLVVISLFISSLLIIYFIMS